MTINAHESAVRAAVEKTKAQAQVNGAQFRVERAQRALDKWKADGARLRSELDAANIALDACKDAAAMAGKEKA